MIKITISLLLIFTFQTHAQKKNIGWQNLYKAQLYKSLPYRLMSPENMDSKTKYPLILSLHGAGGRGSNNKKQLKQWNAQLADEKIRKQFPAYVLAPQSKGLWNLETLELIKELIAQLPNVDMDRIYILGHSMGGHGTFIYIQNDPNYFAAAAPSAGTGLKSTASFIKPELIKDIPIWASHGDKDKVCPYDRIVEVMNKMKALNGNFKLTTWKNGNHGVSDRFIPGDESGVTEQSSSRCDPESNFMIWLFSNKKQ